MAAFRVLVIEDDAAVASSLLRTLTRADIQTFWAKNGADGLDLKRSLRPHVVLVDLSLPDFDGIGLVKLLAQHGDCGIIIVSGMGDEADRIVGLEVGADDYIAKPPRLRELVARVRAVYRRIHDAPDTRPQVAMPSLVQLGNVTIDMADRAMRALGGERILLTAAEFAALEMLLAAKGESVSRAQLSEVALHRAWRPSDRSVDQLIFHLRQKLASADNQPLIRSIRGSGYKLAAPT